MKAADFEQSKQYAFDSFCRKVLKNEACNFHIENRRQLEREALFSELSESEMMQLFAMDAYPCEQTYFNVLGYEVPIKCDLLADALSALPKKKQEILLLYITLGKTDQEISDLLHTPRRTIQYQRIGTMRQLKKYMETKADE